MLLSLFSILAGAAIGRLRGGHHHGFIRTSIKAKPLLLSAVAAALVLTVLTPSQPLFWTAVVVLAGFGFMLSNLHLTGMITMAIGLAANVLPLLANGAMPVSERALRSVDAVDANGVVIVEGARELVAEAPRLSVLGDVIPVPIFGAVVSIGDLIMLVALADVVTNIFLRGRQRPDEDGIWFASDELDEELLVAGEDDVIDLTGDHATVHRGPAHAAGGTLTWLSSLGRQIKAATVRTPEHARIDEQPPPPTGDPILAPPPLASPPPVPTAPARAERTLVAAGNQEPVIDLTDSGPDVVDFIPPEDLPAPKAIAAPPALDLTDRRPIIDLTVSPTDEQMGEFMRRRAEADRRIAQSQLAPMAPGHRRNRLRGRRRYTGRVNATR